MQGDRPGPGSTPGAGRGGSRRIRPGLEPRRFGSSKRDAKGNLLIVVEELPHGRTGPVEVEGRVPQLEIEPRAVAPVIEVVVLAVFCGKGELAREPSAQRQPLAEGELSAQPVFVGPEVVPLEGGKRSQPAVLPE